MTDRKSLHYSLNTLLSNQLALSKEQFSFLKKVGEWVIQQMNTTDLHGFPHVLRVLNLCITLQKAEGGDVFILFLATLLHDVGRDYTSQNDNHAKKSAEMAKTFLHSDFIHLHEETTQHILQCILAHSFSTNSPANSLEAKILSDADKIEAIGAIGIYRAACFQHENGTGLLAMHQHFYDKLLQLPSKMYTQTGREITDSRIQLMKVYITQLEHELGLNLTKTE